MANPKISKKTTTVMTIKGNYSRTGEILLEDGEGCMDLLSLASMFDGMDVKITIRAEESENEEE